MRRGAGKFPAVSVPVFNAGRIPFLQEIGKNKKR